MLGPKSKYSSVCMYLFGNNIAHMSKAGYGAIYKGLGISLQIWSMALI